MVPRRLFALLVLAAVFACKSATAPLPTDTDNAIVVTAMAQVVAPGSPIYFRVANSENYDIVINVCSGQLERRIGDHWEEFTTRFPAPCTDIGTAVPPNQSRQSLYPTPVDAPDGDFRLRLTMTGLSDSQRILKRSSIFTFKR